MPAMKIAGILSFGLLQKCKDSLHLTNTPILHKQLIFKSLKLLARIMVIVMQNPKHQHLQL